MAEIARSRTIAAEPQEVWDVLADFGSISSWADNVDHSCILNHGGGPVGTTRRVQIGRNALVERITEFDPPAALAYDVEGLPKRGCARSTTAGRCAASRNGDTVVTLTSTVEIGSGPLAQLRRTGGLPRAWRASPTSMLAGLAQAIGEDSCLIGPTSSS